MTRHACANDDTGGDKPQHALALDRTVLKAPGEPPAAGEIDERADISAVGIMLWEPVTGRHPLERSRAALPSVAVVSQPMPFLAKQQPELMPLADIIDRCLRKRKAERIPSARALLAAAAAGRPWQWPGTFSSPSAPGTRQLTGSALSLGLLLSAGAASWRNRSAMAQDTQQSDPAEPAQRLHPEPRRAEEEMVTETSGDGRQHALGLGHAVAEASDEPSAVVVAPDQASEQQSLSTVSIQDARARPGGAGSGQVLPVPGSALGQYELIRELGRGGMGAVYLARDTRLGRRVAVKVLSRRNESLAKRFLAEAQATARCKHDNIVIIHDVGEAPDCSYMVLEYIEGITLRAWLKGRWQPNQPAQGGASSALAPDNAGAPQLPEARVSPTLAVEMMVPVVRALAHAHSHGLVHRDLKPENIMLSDTGSLKVLDFGIAKLLGHEPAAATPRPVATDVMADEAFRALWAARGALTAPNKIIGTLPYMAPEQWSAGEIDERTDIWAVGIMLWELVTGRHPLSRSQEALRSVPLLDKPMPSLAKERPELMPLAGIIDRCLRKRQAERIASAQALLAELEPLLPGRSAPSRSAAGETGNPYAGLAAFQEADAARFFGRERDVVGMMAQLGNHRLVTVAGASGAGKSSFVRAGVIPALKRSGQRWESFIIRPGREPLGALASVLVHIGQDTLQDDNDEQDSGKPDKEASGRDTLIATLRAQPGHLGTALRSHAHRQHLRILLFVDQFEELYTLGADRQTRSAFVQCLEGVADDASSPLRVVLSLRSDFLDRVAEDRAFTSELTRALTLLPGLGRAELREALVRPLEAVGHRFESEELIASMLDNLEATRTPLPLLQFTAAKLWDARDRERHLLTRTSYEAMGGVAGALAAHADAVLAGLPVADQRLARVVFTSLVTEERTRAIVSMGELCAMAPPAAAAGMSDPRTAMEQVVQHLAQARLLLIDTDVDRGGQTVEISHESLLERWPRLSRWLAEDEEAAAFQARLRAAAREWDRQGRSEDLLWRGRAADEAARWLEHGIGGLGEDTARAALALRDRDYLDAVVALAVRARQRRRQVVGVIIASLAMVALVVSLLALRARSEARRAEEQATRAERQAVQARNASRMAAAREQEADPTLVLSLLRELDPSHLPKRWKELARWAMQQGVARVVLSHPAYVYSAAFSPDGTRIASASMDKTVRVWNADGSGQPLLLLGHLDNVLSVAFSPDGARIASASRDKTVRVWNADGSGQPLLLLGHLDQVNSAAFSPDGTRIASASRDKTVRVWNADGSGQPLVLLGHLDNVLSVAFSPDGTRIVSASADKTVRVWNADGSGQPLVLLGHLDQITSAAFSPDGTRIASASYDKTVRVWNADGSGQPLVLLGHLDPIFSVAFSPDGTRIGSASRDKTVRVWNADGSGQPLVLLGHLALVYSAAFSPDGTRIVSASVDKTVRVWNADGSGQPLVLLGHLDVVFSAAFSPDGTRIVTASNDKTVRVWNADGSGQPLVLLGHQDTVYSAAFSPDSTRIVSAARDKTVRVWNADGSGQPLVLLGHQDTVHSAAFSPDGTRIVSASKDKTARVWNADGSGTPLVLPGHQDTVYSAAFSPDGTRIASTSWDKTVRVWNADGSGKPLILSGHEAAVGAGAPGGQGVFSPDGKHIITFSDDKTIRLWNTDGSGQPVILRTPDLNACTVAFSPDGKHIVSASHARHAIWVWPEVVPLSGPDDPALWRATNYCPPIELRMELLGVPEDIARRDLTQCQRRVEAAR